MMQKTATQVRARKETKGAGAEVALGVCSQGSAETMQHSTAGYAPGGPSTTTAPWRG